jgi:hypothetical protein
MMRVFAASFTIKSNSMILKQSKALIKPRNGYSKFSLHNFVILVYTAARMGRKK